MSRRLLACLLLCAALLMQAFGAEAYAASGAGGSDHCRKARAGIAATQSDSEQAPADRGRVQHDCSMCQVGFGHAMAGAAPADAVPIFAPWRISVQVLVTDSAPAQFIRHVVGARAPPVAL